VEVASVLLVEDNPADARYVRELLEEMKSGGGSYSGAVIEISHAERVADAVRMLDSLHVDAILLDLSLPDAHGVSTVRRVRIAAPNIPIIVLTGSDDEALALLTLREGAQDYLVKGRLEQDALHRSMRYSIERHASERQRRSLIAELDHRVKNNLATVLAIAEQSLRVVGSLAEFKVSFTGRIRAMARVYTVLSRSQWQGAELSALVRMSIEPYLRANSVVISGEEVRLSSRTACALCMTFNELATNAAKYGAFSAPGGVVNIRWVVRAGMDAAGKPERRLVLEWTETGGPPIGAPITRGLGYNLIVGCVPHELNGTVQYEFPKQGAYLRMEAPLVDEDPSLAPPGLGLQGGPDPRLS
jgi:two-component sensor histidine kinase